MNTDPKKLLSYDPAAVVMRASCDGDTLERVRNFAEQLTRHLDRMMHQPVVVSRSREEQRRMASEGNALLKDNLSTVENSLLGTKEEPIDVDAGQEPTAGTEKIEDIPTGNHSSLEDPQEGAVAAVEHKVAARNLLNEEEGWSRRVSLQAEQESNSEVNSLMGNHVKKVLEDDPLHDVQEGSVFGADPTTHDPATTESEDHEKEEDTSCKESNPIIQEDDPKVKEEEYEEEPDAVSESCPVKSVKGEPGTVPSSSIWSSSSSSSDSDIDDIDSDNNNNNNNSCCDRGTKRVKQGEEEEDSDDATEETAGRHRKRARRVSEDGMVTHRSPRILPPGCKGNLQETKLRRSVGHTRKVLNQNLKLLGLTACFSTGVVSTRGSVVSHITLSESWNYLPRNTTETLEWWLGMGATRLNLASPLDPGRYGQPRGDGIPVFWACKSSLRGGNRCHYVGHFRCIGFDKQHASAKGQCRQALIEFEFVKFDEVLSEKLSNL